MLVSTWAGAEQRGQVAAGLRPRPEYLELERRGLELLDWSRLRPAPRRRTPVTAVVHTAAALRRLSRFDAVFSDGENVGIALALAMRATRLRRPHLMLGHYLSNGRKRAAVRRLRPQECIDRIVVHSPRQAELAQLELGIPAAKLRFDPYYVDTVFWSPSPAADERMILAAGLDHRDYSTLAAAWGGRPEPVYVAAGSLHSPRATARLPASWPSNFQAGFADHRRLRELYAAASLVVVPVIESDFQAGITTVLEAMAMARPVVATASRGWSGVIEDGETGLLVPPGDPEALRHAIARLLTDPALRARLGRQAREAAVSRYRLEAYADRLLDHLAAIGPETRVARR